MKSLIAATFLAGIASFYIIPSFAVDANAGVAPPECANPNTQMKHPDWYRPGGYCAPNAGNQAGSGPGQASSPPPG